MQRDYRWLGKFYRNYLPFTFIDNETIAMDNEAVFTTGSNAITVLNCRCFAIERVKFGFQMRDGAENPILCYADAAGSIYFGPNAQLHSVKFMKGIDTDYENIYFASRFDYNANWFELENMVFASKPNNSAWNFTGVMNGNVTGNLKIMFMLQGRYWRY